MYDLAEIYHSEDIDQAAYEFVSECNIKEGSYNHLATCKERIPSHFEIGRVYSNLILKITTDEKDYIKTLITVLSSWIIKTIDNYNSSMYYENPDYIYECYKAGYVL